MNNVEEFVPATFPGNSDFSALMENTFKYSEYYLRGKNYYLHPWQLSDTGKVQSVNNFKNFIIDSLSQNYPVLYLQLNGAYTEYNLHWMTITKYFENKKLPFVIWVDSI